MKKRINNFSGILLFSLILLGFSACNRSHNKGLEHIPKDATLVFSINFKQIKEKLKESSLNADSLMNKLKTQDSAFALLKDFDLKQPLLGFMKNSSSMMQGNDLVTGFVAAMGNKSDLEKDLKELKPDKQIQKGKEISFVQMDDHAFLAWNDDFVIGIYGNKISPSDLDGYFAMKKDASLADVKEAVKLLGVEGDLSFYGNGNGSLASIPFLGMSKASDLLKDNYGGGTINFEKGKVLFNAKNYLNSTLTDLIKKNPTKDLSGDGLQNFPGSPLGFFEISFNIKQILSFLEYAGVKNTADAYLKNMGLSLDDIQEAFKGEVNVAVSDLHPVSKNIPYGDSSITVKNPDPKIIFNIPLSNKATYDKIAQALVKMGIFIEVNGQMVPKEMTSLSGTYRVTDKAIIIATDSTLAADFIAGNKKIVYPEGLDRKGKTSIGYANLQSIFQSFATDEHKQSDSSLQLAVKTFKDFTVSADNMKGNEASFEMVLHMQDNSKNSLSILADFIQQENLIKKAKAATAGSALDDSMDTNIAAPPIVTPDTTR